MGANVGWSGGSPAGIGSNGVKKIRGKPSDAWQGESRRRRAWRRQRAGLKAVEVVKDVGCRQARPSHRAARDRPGPP